MEIGYLRQSQEFPDDVTVHDLLVAKLGTAGLVLFVGVSGVALALVARSRILFLLAVAGYYAGTLTLAMLGGSPDAAFTDLNAFNFILIAMAVGVGLGLFDLIGLGFLLGGLLHGVAPVGLDPRRARAAGHQSRSPAPGSTRR